MRVACMDTVNLCGGVMYKGFYYISLIKAGLYLRVTFIFWILQITLQKKKLICFSVGKWQVGAAVYWNMHTYMCQYCGIGLRPLLKDKIGHVFFQFFPPVAPILFCTFQMVLHHFWQDPQHHWLKCSINHIKASTTCYKWL